MVAFAAKKFVVDAYVNEASEVVELVKVWSALHVFAFERFKDATPPAYESPPEKVVVATQVGTPFTSASV